MNFKTKKKDRNRSTKSLFYKRRMARLYPTIQFRRTLEIEGIENLSLQRGRITEITGKEHSGKTSLVLKIAETILADHGIVVYIDATSSFDSAKRSCYPDNFIIIQTNIIENALAICKEIKDKINIDLLVIDPLPAMITMEEYSSALGEDKSSYNSNLIRAVHSFSALCMDSFLLVINNERCLDEETYVYSNHLIKKIKDLKIGDSVLGENNDYLKIINMTERSEIEGIELETEDSCNLSMSLNHLQPVYRDGEIILLEGRSIKEGDSLITPISNPCINQTHETWFNDYAPFHIGGILPEVKGALAAIIGNIVHRLRFFDKTNKKFQFAEVNIEKFTYLIKMLRQSTNYKVKRFCHSLLEFFPNIESSIVKANLITIATFFSDKSPDVPDFIMQGNRTVLKEYARALSLNAKNMDIEGFYLQRLKEDYSLIVLMYALGVFIRKTKEGKLYWYKISYDQANNFTEKIGFVEKDRNAFRFLHNGASFFPVECKYKLSKIVSTIKKKMWVQDIEVEEDKYFIANTFLTHNSDILKFGMKEYGGLSLKHLCHQQVQVSIKKEKITCINLKIYDYDTKNKVTSRLLLSDD